MFEYSSKTKVDNAPQPSLRLEAEQLEFLAAGESAKLSKLKWISTMANHGPAASNQAFSPGIVCGYGMNAGGTFGKCSEKYRTMKEVSREEGGSSYFLTGTF